MRGGEGNFIVEPPGDDADLIPRRNRERVNRRLRPVCKIRQRTHQQGRRSEMFHPRRRDRRSAMRRSEHDHPVYESALPRRGEFRQRHPGEQPAHAVGDQVDLRFAKLPEKPGQFESMFEDMVPGGPVVVEDRPPPPAGKPARESPHHDAAMKQPMHQDDGERPRGSGKNFDVPKPGGIANERINHDSPEFIFGTTSYYIRDSRKIHPHPPSGGAPVRNAPPAAGA